MNHVNLILAITTTITRSSSKCTIKSLWVYRHEYIDLQDHSNCAIPIIGKHYQISMILKPLEKQSVLFQNETCLSAILVLPILLTWFLLDYYYN